MALIRFTGGAGSATQQENASLIDNYDLLRLPQDDDDLVLENTAEGWLYDYDFSAVDLKSLAIKQSFTGLFGQADDPVLLRAGCRVEIGEHYGQGAPPGSARINLSLVATSGAAQATTVIVHNTASSPQDTYLMPCRICLDDADGTIEVRRGHVGIAERADDVATFDKLTLSYVTSRASDADVHLGSGAILRLVDQQGGSLRMECGLSGSSPKIEQSAGTLVLDTADNVPELYAGGGTAYLDRFGTITTLYMDGGDVDLTRTTQLRTITTVSWRVAKGSLKYDPDYVTITNKPSPSVAMKLAASEN